MQKLNFNYNQKKVLTIVLTTVSVVMIGIIVTLATLFGLTVNDHMGLRGETENRYQASYYGLVTNFVDIENNLAKTRVMTSPRMLEDTLDKVSDNCDLASVHLSILTTKENQLTNINQFINQLNGYSMYLVRNLAGGDLLTTSNTETLDAMWNVSREYGRAISGMRDHISNGYSFVESLGSIDDKFDGIFTGMDDSAIEYPTLIFDGPFSDGVTDREVKGTVGDDISEAQARELVAKYLVGYDIVEIKEVILNEYRIPSYIFTVLLEGGRDCSVQIARKGGLLLMLDLYHQVVEPTLTLDQCKVLAKQYCDSIGLKGMEAPAWTAFKERQAHLLNRSAACRGRAAPPPPPRSTPPSSWSRLCEG